MKLKQAVKLLKSYNKWRRYVGVNGKGPKMLDSKQVGIAIDVVIDYYENEIIKNT